MRKFNKGFTNLLPLAIGMITLSAGVTLMFILPEYLIYILNTTGQFSTETISTATTQLGVVRGVGMAVIVISLIWVIIWVISGAHMAKGEA